MQRTTDTSMAWDVQDEQDGLDAALETAARGRRGHERELEEFLREFQDQDSDYEVLEFRAAASFDDEY